MEIAVAGWRRLRVARWRRRGGVLRIRFKEVVPLRGDRRDLRRRRRAVLRAIRAERKEAVTQELQELSKGRVPLVRLRPGPGDGAVIVEFTGDVRFLLTVRDCRAELRRLERRAMRGDVYLERVHPCFGRSWYWLWFLSWDGREELFAKVTPFADLPPATHRERRRLSRLLPRGW
ncbi:MAG: hypothetical protein ACRDYY_15340 [Acidimicrobiales bacterium]